MEMLTQAQLRLIDFEKAQEILDKEGPIALYVYLSTRGGKYALLMLRVVCESYSFIGTVVIRHMGKIIHKFINRRLTFKEINNIIYLLAKDYLSMIRDKQEYKGDYGEITADEVQKIYNSFFKKKSYF